MAPSFAGTTNGTRIALNFRDQWPGIGNDFKTYTFAADHNFVYRRIGIGAMIINDRLGGNAIRNMNYILQFNKGILMEKDIELRTGFQCNYRRIKYDVSNYIFANQLEYNGSISNLESEVPVSLESQIDFGTSILLQNKSAWLGAGMSNIKIPVLDISNSMYAKGIELSVFGGFKLQLTRNYKYKGRDNLYYVAYVRKQGVFIESNTGAYFERAPFLVGAFYRGLPSSGFIETIQNHDAIIFMVGYSYKNFWLTYSYDFTLRKVIQYTGGAHEITLSIKFKQVDVRNKKFSIPCPRA